MDAIEGETDLSSFVFRHPGMAKNTFSNGKKYTISKNERLRISLFHEKERRVMAEARCSVFEEMYTKQVSQNFDDKTRLEEMTREIAKLKHDIEVMDKQRIDDIIFWV